MGNRLSKISIIAENSDIALQKIQMISTIFYKLRLLAGKGEVYRRLYEELVQSRRYDRYSLLVRTMSYPGRLVGLLSSGDIRTISLLEYSSMRTDKLLSFHKQKNYILYLNKCIPYLKFTKFTTTGYLIIHPNNIYTLVAMCKGFIDQSVSSPSFLSKEEQHVYIQLIENFNAYLNNYTDLYRR